MAVSLDTGGGINGREMDVLFQTEGEAVRFGVQTVKVSIVGHMNNWRELR